MSNPDHDADILRAQKATSTDPERLEREAQIAERCLEPVAVSLLDRAMKLTTDIYWSTNEPKTDHLAGQLIDVLKKLGAS